MRLIRIPLSIAGTTLLFAGCPESVATQGDTTSIDAATDATADATVDAAQPDGVRARRGGDAVPETGAPDVSVDTTGTPDADVTIAPDVLVDAVADAHADGSDPDADGSGPDADGSGPDADGFGLETDAAIPDGTGDAACWQPTPSEIGELVGHECPPEYYQNGQLGFCDDANELVVGCVGGTWLDAATIAGDPSLPCNCFGSEPVSCGPEPFGCAVIGYAGISVAGAPRHGGTPLRQV